MKPPHRNSYFISPPQLLPPWTMQYALRKVSLYIGDALTICPVSKSSLCCTLIAAYWHTDTNLLHQIDANVAQQLSQPWKATLPTLGLLCTRDYSAPRLPREFVELDLFHYTESKWKGYLIRFDSLLFPVASKQTWRVANSSACQKIWLDKSPSYYGPIPFREKYLTRPFWVATYFEYCTYLQHPRRLHRIVDMTLTKIHRNGWASRSCCWEPSLDCAVCKQKLSHRTNWYTWCRRSYDDLWMFVFLSCRMVEWNR